MWFGSDNSSEEEMDQLYDLVIRPAIEQQGLSAYHVGKDLRANKLDDAILDAIDRSVIVVVDLTQRSGYGSTGKCYFRSRIHI